MPEIRCSVCGSTIKLGDGSNPSTELRDGISYLVPETVRNENCCGNDRTNARLEVLRAAGVNVEKLQSLLQTDSAVKEIFDNEDPILNQILEGGFIRNRELFRRFITAQTFALIGDGHKSWTEQVRRRYDTRYVFKQTLDELNLLIKLSNKGLYGKDKRFRFFTLYDLKEIFKELIYYGFRGDDRETMKNRIMDSTSYSQLRVAVTSRGWFFKHKCKFIPQTWLNCFKGAGAYYTLQNIIRTHGFVIPSCTDMNSSLELVENMFTNIVSYHSSHRRWDMMMSLLTTSVAQTNFQLQW